MSQREKELLEKILAAARASQLTKQAAIATSEEITKDDDNTPKQIPLQFPVKGDNQSKP